MKLRTKTVRKTVSLLDGIIKEYKEESVKQPRNWRTYEQQLSLRIRTALRSFTPLIDEACSVLTIVRAEKRGQKPKLALRQRVTVLLLKHLFQKSNREMANMLVLFSPLSDIDVSYKSIERLYSDHEVDLVLMNMQMLLLRKKDITEVDTCGDGTGYSVTVKKHYASEAEKLKDKSNKRTKKKSKKKPKKVAKYIFSFRLMDLDTRLYVGFGTSFKSEKEAYLKAMEMARNVGIKSIRLDRYYSAQKYVKKLEEWFGKGVRIYLVPKKNVTIRGTQKWKKMLAYFVNNTKGFLKEYFKRNQSESGFSEDKRRFGWKIPQRRKDRIETYDFCTALWHNLFWLEG